MRRNKRLLMYAPLALAGMALFIFVGGEVVMHLWNWLVPDLFGWKQVTFWQALALLALTRILVGGFGMHGGGMRSHYRRRMAERWDRMTPEERQKFCGGLHSRWNRESPGDSGQFEG